jgi:prevent-host-death family protein
MESVPIRVLNQDTASVLAKVERGATVEITNRGHVIARIVPAEPNELADLVARGRITPATDTAPITMPPGAVDTSVDSAAVVSELREERP